MVNSFNINSRNVSEAERTIMQTYKCLISFGRFFLGGDFNKCPSSPVHFKIGDELISRSTKPLAIIIARDHGKTTLVKASIIRDFSFAKKAKEWGLAEEERHLFYGWVSSSQRKSKGNVQYMRMHFEHNELLNYYFGDQKLRIYNLKGSIWNQEEIVTAYGDKLISSSNLTSMRGDTQPTIARGSLRYSRVFCDDCENEENTKTPNSRASIVDNIMDGILPAIEANEDYCRLIFIGTPMHFASMAQGFIDREAKLRKKGEKALDDHSWKMMVYGATQPQMEGGVLWHGRMSRPVLDKKKKEYRESDKGEAGYWQEYELKVQSSEFALLTRGHVKHWNGFYLREDGLNYIVVGSKLKPIKHVVNTFLGCDPATDIDTKGSDYSVIMAIAVDMMNNTLVLEYVRKRNIPTIGLRDAQGKLLGRMGVVDYLFEFYLKYHCVSGTVEDVAMTRSVFQSLHSEYLRRNITLSIIPEKPGGRDKINKIYSGLAPHFNRSGVFLLDGHYDLEHEIITFGSKMAHDDTIESLYFARKNAFPPIMKIDKQTSRYVQPIIKAKPWKVA